jgi:hypothetical protein
MFDQYFTEQWAEREQPIILAAIITSKPKKKEVLS